MGKFIPEQLPEPLTYYEDSEGLTLRGRGKWRTTGCVFHGGSDSMRINLTRGAFICMACDAKGGDVVAYHQAVHGLGFVEAAKALGAYQDDGKPHLGAISAAPIPARVLLASVAHELTLICMIATDMTKGRAVSAEDAARLLQATNRVSHVATVANARRN